MTFPASANYIIDPFLLYNNITEKYNRLFREWVIRKRVINGNNPVIKR